MTEQERFHFDYVCGDTGLIDEQAELKWFIENCCSITDLKKNWKTVCNKLNEINEENEELKQAYVKLKHYHSNLHDECIELEWDKDRYYKDVLTLEQENEELKKENKAFEHHLSELQGENEILTKENETLKNNLKEID